MMHYTLIVKEIFQDGSLLPANYVGPAPWREDTDIFMYTSLEFDELRKKLSTIYNPVVHDNVDSFNNPHVDEEGHHDWPKLGSHLLLIRDGKIMDIRVRVGQKVVDELYCEVYP